MDRAIQRLVDPYGDSFWYTSPNLWEPPVQTALKDLCRPGATVFDVGANFGGLTSAMSRLVGPRGVVCSFEASPRIFGYLQGNIVKQGHNNVTAYHCAVYSRSNERVKIYPGDHLNDSIYDYGHGRSGEFYWVNTLSLDSFCAETGLVPSVIKMDIEGAEFDALNGAVGLIAEHRPHLILEQQPNDTRCLDFLKRSGYQALDLNAYRLINSAADFPPNVSLRNVLFVHPMRSGDLAYQLPPRVDAVAELRASDFARTGNTFASSAPMHLGPGRYLMDVFFAASGTSNELMCGVKVDGQVVFRYHGYSKLIADSYRDWVVDVTRGSDIELYFDFINGTFDDTFVLSGARIQRLTGFSPNAALQFVMP
jgi:FkbM family methyltransferase